MIRFIEAALCQMGLHQWHYRKNGKATERVCTRSSCDARERLQERKDDSSIHICINAEEVIL